MSIDLTRFKVLALDFDGVVVDSNDIKDEGFRQIFREFPEHYDAMMAYHLSDNAVPRQEKFKHIATQILGRAEDDPLIAQWVDRYTLFTRKAVVECPMLPGATEFLERASKRWPLYLASATPQGELDRIVDARGLRRFFKGVYGAPERKVSMFERVTQIEKIRAEQILFFGDSDQDLTSARRAKVEFVGVIGKSQFTGEGVTVIENLGRLLSPVVESSQMTVRGWRRYMNGLIGREISLMTRYSDRVVQWAPLAHDSGVLLSSIETSTTVASVTETSATAAPSIEKTSDPSATWAHESDQDRTVILLNGNFNHHNDIQSLLRDLHGRVTRFSRVVAVIYNPYLRWLYGFASKIGIRKGPAPTTFVTETDLKNLCKLSGFELVRLRPVGVFPWQCFGLGRFLNALIPAVPGLRWISFAVVATLRPIKAGHCGRMPKLTVVIPARNERGNIEAALKRMPKLGGERLEVIYVEGHSSDGTWEEIERVLPLYQSQFTVRAYRQTGKGKADAVRLGFSHATGDILTILDADLTMPPEKLGSFFDAYTEGLADFINGSRLVYPMEGEAMRFLNRLGNVFFAKSLSAVLDQRIGDSLCGTKLVTRRDYARMTAWRKDFGDFDPFGDFELLFPAALLGLGVVDVPIRYLARTYGSTNIHRFRHGWQLLMMTLTGLLRVRMGSGAKD